MLISEWIAYDQLDRIPDPYWIGAQICEVIARAMGSKKRGGIEDWIPREKPVRIVSGDAGMAMMEGILAVQGARSK